jgi:hypothetical protein
VTSENGPRVPFETRRVTIGVGSLGDFARLRHFREIRGTQVSRLKRALLEADLGRVLPGALTLHRSNGGELVVVDGTHRLEAVKQLIEEDPSLKFTFEAHIYKGLDHAQIMRLFADVNGGTRVTPLDMLEVRQDDFPIVGMLKRDFPCPVAFARGGLKEGFRVLTLLKAYVSMGTRGGPNNDKALWDAIGRMKHEDYLRLRRFVDAFIAAFGKPGQNNAFSKHMPVLCLAKIYYANIDAGGLSHDEVVDRWAERVAENQTVRQSLLVSGLHAIPFVVNTIVTAMNEGHRKRPAILPAAIEWSGKTGGAAQ